MELSAELASVIRKSTLFCSLNEQDCQLITANLRAMDYQQEQLIFSKGDNSSQVYFIVNGRVRISVLSNDGREISFSHCIKGDFFGEIAALDKSPRSANAVALTNATLIPIPGTVIRNAAATHPSVSIALIDLLCRRIRETSDQLESNSLFSIDVRLARFLLHELNKLPSGSDSIDLGMSQRELALLICASRPKVSGALHRLAAIGAITRSGSVIYCNRALLERNGNSN